MIKNRQCIICGCVGVANTHDNKALYVCNKKKKCKRAIQQHLENPIAKAILEGSFAPKDVVPVDFVDGGFQFRRTVH